MWSTPLARATSIGAVGRAVVDDEPLDGVEAGELAGQVGERGGERLLLVQAGDLDDELHRRSAPLAYLPRWRARPSPGRGRSPRCLARSRLAAGSALGAARASRRVVGLPASTRRIRTTTRTTRCSGAASCSTASCRSYEAYRAPTPHPLATLVGALIAPLGHGAERVWIALCVVSFVALVVGVYRLAREAFTPLVGLVAARAALHALRLPVLRRARLHRHRLHGVRRLGGRARGAPAAPRHAGASCCSRIAGTLRPEAWLMAGLYWLWVAWPATLGASACGYAALAAHRPGRLGGQRLDRHRRPAVLADLHEQLRRGARARQGRRRPARGDLGVPRQARQVPGAARRDRRPRPRRCCSSRGGWSCPLVAARPSASARSCSSASAASASSTATCSSASLMVMVFCAVALAGWTMLEHGTRAAARLGGRARRCSSSTASSFTATRVNLDRLDNELTLPRRRPRRAARRARRPRRSAPACAAGRSTSRTTSSSPTCAGSLDLPDGARAGPQRGAPRAAHARRARAGARGSRRRIAAGGVRSSRTSALALFRQALVEETDDPATVLPLPGYERVAVSDYYSAYVRCSRASPSRRRAGAGARRAPRAGRGAGAPGRATRGRAARWPWWAGGRRCCCSCSLLLRLWGADHGLPYAYNADENAHFVPRAIGLYGHEWNPDYFVNPPAYTYVLHVVFTRLVRRARGRLAAVRHRPDRGVGRRARRSPRCSARSPSGCSTSPARGCSTAASACSPPALSSVAFLPVFYSHLALNDVPTLAAVCLALYGVAGVAAPGPAARLRRSPASGSGLACATKYTGGIVLLPLLAAAAVQFAAPGGRGLAIRGAGARAARARSPRSSSPTRTRCSTSRRSGTASPTSPRRAARRGRRASSA